MCLYTGRQAAPSVLRTVSVLGATYAAQRHAATDDGMRADVHVPRSHVRPRAALQDLCGNHSSATTCLTLVPWRRM